MIPNGATRGANPEMDARSFILGGQAITNQAVCESDLEKRGKLLTSRGFGQAIQISPF